MSTLDLEFARNAQLLKQGLVRSSHRRTSFTKVASEVFDELATDQSWTVAKEENLGLMNAIRPSRGAAIVACAKNEGVNFLEWLAHHRAAGFEHVFVYTNNNRDGSEALYDALAQDGLITFIQNEIGSSASPQIKAYEHSVHFLHELRDFEWVAYLDIDEFIVLADKFDYSIHNLLQALKAAYPDNLPAAICFNWDWYGSGGAVLRAPGLIQDRFVHSTPHPLVKSVIRLPQVKSMRCIHIPEMWTPHAVNSAFEPADISTYMIAPPEFSGGKINHYYHKSFEEFGIKRDRGEGSSAGGLSGKNLETFFTWDIPLGADTLNPVPKLLRQRVQTELDRLLSIASIADAQNRVEGQYVSLTRGVNGSELVELHSSLTKTLQPDNWHRDFRNDNVSSG